MDCIILLILINLIWKLSVINSMERMPTSIISVLEILRRKGEMMPTHFWTIMESSRISINFAVRAASNWARERWPIATTDADRNFQVRSRSFMISFTDRRWVIDDSTKKLNLDIVFVLLQRLWLSAKQYLRE